MANAPDTSSYVLTNPDSNLPNSSVIIGGTGITVNKSGSNVSVAATSNLLQLAETSAGGYTVYDTTLGFNQNRFTAGLGMAITNPTGTGGVPTNFAVIPESTIQLINVSQNGTPIVSDGRPNLNFSSSNGISLSIGSDANNVNIEISGDESSVAPDDATYILQTPDASLPNAQALSDLDQTGLMKVTVSEAPSALISIAVPATTSAANDYQAGSTILSSLAELTPSVGTILVGNGTAFNVLSPGSANEVLTIISSTPSWQPPVGGSGITVNIMSPSAPSQLLVTNNEYVSTNTAVQNFTLPASPSPGEWYIISGYGSGGWSLALSSKTATMGNVSGTTSIASTAPTDAIKITCIDSTHFSIQGFSGQVSIT